ncbi:MAG: type I 3-dehydroquinate dehydratase [Anaerolineae bacterium]|nr:type I 3-dehydroquinate dehydratase [Caldilineales bacterium]MCX7852931.1 type I 3-dehydroquinate dehydratase [Caldilineales bacterium]MDW8268467.1 type I 3-dehydroquinate dehydratase [Anaerolineae bacterium]
MSSITTHLAVAVTAANTEAALAQAAAVADRATLVEYRLDGMADFDLEQLIAASPLPAIITCRAREEGGHFPGPEPERRAVLREAVARGAAFVDAEAAVLPELAARPHPRTRLIGSRHDFTGMLGDWTTAGRHLRALGADIVKLAGMAVQPDDVLTPLAWLDRLEGPGIGIAMGEHGLATRLLAPRFPCAFLTFAAATEATATAPGQLTVATLVADFGFWQIAAAAPLILLLTPAPVPWDLVAAYRALLAERPASPGYQPWLLPLPVTVLSPGLWLACRLARADAIVCLPEVERRPELSAYGVHPTAVAWHFSAADDGRPVTRLCDHPDHLADFIRDL